MAKSYILVLMGLFSVLATSAIAQITLVGTHYTQNFDTFASGLPAGWTVSTSATPSDLGTPATFSSAPESWASTTNPFRNISSHNVAFGSNSSQQSANPNRALGWRPVGDNSGAVVPLRTGAITLAIANTLGFCNFRLSLRLFQPHNTAGSQTYRVEYRIGSSGNFTAIGADYLTADAGESHLDYHVRQFSSVTLTGIDDQASVVYLRIRGLSTVGSSNLDTIGLDDFSLVYSAIPEASSFAALAALAALGLVTTRRRRTA